MSTLYGDSIFESRNIAIDILIESIDNDMKLFDGLISESVLNEDVKFSLSNLADKIKKVIRFIKAKINEIIGKISGNLLFNKMAKELRTTKLPVDILVPNMNEFNKFIGTVTDYYKLTEKCRFSKTQEELDSNEAKADDTDDRLNKTFFKDNEEGKSVFNSNFFYNQPINTEEDRKKIINKPVLEKFRKPYVDAISGIKKFTSILNNIEKDLNKIEQEIKSLENSSGDENTSFILKKNKIVAYGYWLTIGYIKDYIGQLTICTRDALYHPKEN